MCNIPRLECEHDSGLYVLSYMEAFTRWAPSRIRLTGSSRTMNPCTLEFQFRSQEHVAGFRRNSRARPQKAENLRAQLIVYLLDRMIEQYHKAGSAQRNEEAVNTAIGLKAFLLEDMYE